METPVCPHCGAHLDSSDSGNIESCPACLLELAIQTQSQPNAQPFVVPDMEQVRAAFPHLEIVEMIGHGGMGTVFKARQGKLERFVALKILSEKLAEMPSFAERFAQEGKLLARLSHPNIVSVYDYGDSNGFYYLVLEYVEGVNMRQAMQEERFTPDQALAIVPKICEALQYAHEEGVLHRDIKPENILLDTRGRVKITDFGIGKLTDSAPNNICETENKTKDISQKSRLTGIKEILGTPSYMAPEQRETPEQVDHRADIYSLGVVFYELLTGQLPKGQFPLPSERTPVDANVDSIVLKAMEREREKRHQTAKEMKTAIEFITENNSSDNYSVERDANSAELLTASALFMYVPLFVLGVFAVFSIMILAMSLFSLEGNERWDENYPIAFVFIRPFFDPFALLGVAGLIVSFITSCGAWSDFFSGLFQKASRRSVMDNRRIGSWFWILAKGTLGIGGVLSLIQMIVILGNMDPELLLEQFCIAWLSLAYAAVLAFLVFMPLSMSILTSRGSGEIFATKTPKPISRTQFYFGVCLSLGIMTPFCMVHGTLWAFWDLASILVLCLALWFGARRNWSTLRNGLLLIPDRKFGAAYTVEYFQGLYRCALFGGGAGMLIGIAVMLSNLDPETIGAGMAITLLCIFYAFVLSTLLFQPLCVAMRKK